MQTEKSINAMNGGKRWWNPLTSRTYLRAAAPFLDGRTLFDIKMRLETRSHWLLRARYLLMTRECWPNLDLSLRPRLQDLTRAVGELDPGDEDDVPDSSGLKSHLFLLAPLPIPFWGECDADADEDGVGWCGIASYRTAYEILVPRGHTLL